MLVALTYTFPFSNLQTHRDVDWAALSYILELMSRIFVFVHRCEGFQMKKKKRDAWQKKEIYKWTNFVFAFTSFANWALRWSSSHLTFLGFSLHFFAPIFSLTEQTLLPKKKGRSSSHQALSSSTFFLSLSQFSDPWFLLDFWYTGISSPGDFVKHISAKLISLRNWSLIFFLFNREAKKSCSKHDLLSFLQASSRRPLLKSKKGTKGSGE